MRWSRLSPKRSRVQKEEYERSELIEKTGGNRYPAIELEDGSVYRKESKAMEETIRAGKLFEKSRTGAAAVSAAPAPSGENPPA